MKDMLDMLGVGIWEWDLRTNQVSLNKQEPVLQNPAIDMGELNKLIHPEDLLRSEQIQKEYFQGNIPFYECEMRMKHPEGHWMWILCRGYVSEWDGDRPIKMKGTHCDISKLKNSEKLLNIQNRLGLVMNSMKDFRETFQDVLNILSEIEPIDCGGIYLIREGEIDLITSIGVGPDFILGASHCDWNAYPYRLLREGTPVYNSLDQIRSKCSPTYEKEGLRSFLSLPIRHQDATVACLNVASHTSDSIPENVRTTLSTIASSLGGHIVRKMTELELETQRRNLRVLVDNLDDLIFVMDMDGNIIHVNKVVEQKLGYTKEQLQNKNVIMLHPPELREQAKKNIDDILQSKREDCRIPVIKATGELLPVESRVTHGKWNEQDAIIGVSRDMTLKEKAEKQEKEYHRLLNIVFNTTSDILALKSREGEYLVVNRMFGDFFGIEDLTGKTAYDFFPPEEAAKIISGDREIMDNKTAVTYTKKIRGTWFTITKDPITDNEGNCTGLLCCATDISAIKETQEALSEAKLHAEEASRLKGEFISIISHELRTPLNSIIGFSRLMKSGLAGDLSQQQQTYANTIFSNGEQLLEIINNMIDLSHIESGDMEMHYESFPVSTAANSITGLLKPLADSKDITLKALIQDSIIHADLLKFKQILYNLLNNAIKFTPKGGEVTLTISCEDDIITRITDTGIGIAKEDLDHLFKPFSQLDSSASRQYPGTGLGLVLVKKFVEMHGGWIEVESELNKGSTFTFSIPKNRHDIL